MNGALWDYLWPCIAAGLLAGVISGIFGLRRNRRRRWLLAGGAALSLAAAAIWHGPFGAGDALAAKSERMAREALVYYEMKQVSAHMHRAPLTRRLILTGPADDFQRSELARVMSQVPGVSRAQWSESPAGPPMMVEAVGAALMGFLIGLLLAYLVELHRRHNAQWNW